jgi:hypothetical protein
LRQKTGKNLKSDLTCFIDIGAYLMNKMLRSPLFLMALTIFIGFAGFGLILPLIPFWAEHLSAGTP